MFKIFNRLTTLLLFIIVSYHCESLAQERLKLIGSLNFSTGEKFQETEIGGLSGIVYDKINKSLLAISDDRSIVNEARFYEFALVLNATQFSLNPIQVTKLKNKDQLYFKKGYPDFEGIALLGNSIIVSSEGGMGKLKPLNPEIFVFNKKGEYIENLSIPDKFLAAKKPATETKGSRDNKVFESLSLALDGKSLFFATEEALLQDGPLTNITTSSHVRVNIYQDKKPVKEIAYKLETIPALKTVDLAPGETGLTDIAAIDEQHFYSLERTYLPFQNKNIIRIFKCKITPQTTNITKLDSLKDPTQFTSVEKTLIADLDDYLGQLNPANLDNIEGLAFGPDLSNGHKTLIVVSDNNFGKNQRTLFMAFEILMNP